jgi:hypothetical protein
LIYFSERRGDETLPNFRKGKHPRKGEIKETRGKDQSPGKPTARKRRATKEERETLKNQTLHQCSEDVYN